MATPNAGLSRITEPPLPTPEANAGVLRFRRIRPGAVAPACQTAEAAGLDSAAAPEDGRPITSEPGRIVLIQTGIIAAIPYGFEGQVRPRSGLATKHGITLINSPGTIDADYRGEIRVPMINHGNDPFTVEPGMRIAQLVIAPVARMRVEEVADVSELGATERGGAGFGSTGIR